jgi:hypothetical protein
MLVLPKLVGQTFLSDNNRIKRYATDRDARATIKVLLQKNEFL